MPDNDENYDDEEADGAFDDADDDGDDDHMEKGDASLLYVVLSC